jgi:hypothetical protein
VTTAGVGSFVGGAMGTVAGAGIAAVITTVGDAFYQRSIERTRDHVRGRLRSTRRPSDGPARADGDRTVVASALPSGPAGDGADDRTRVTGTSPDDTPTMVIGSGGPAGSAGEATQVHGPGTRVLSPDDDQATALVGSPGGPDGPGGDGPDGDGPGGEDEPPRRPPWKRYALLAATALLIFLIAMLTITGIERIKGSPLSGGESGTSVGSVIGTAPSTSAEPSAPETTSSDPSGGAEATTTSEAPSGGTGETSEPESTTTTSRAPQLVPSGLLPGNN